MRYHHLVLLLACLVNRATEAAKKTAPSRTKATKNVDPDEAKAPLRSGHIDLLDADTMKYYMNPSTQQDYDVVVLFYAQWCQNCRGLSPIYIKIAELLKAGESQLIMGYFDCEKDREHSKVCTAAGITHYPTIQFYSLAGRGQYLPSKKTVPKHATQFEGNWQHGEIILDWIKAMMFLSKWHRSGWGEKLRSFFFAGKKSKDAAKSVLPVGIPQVDANKLKVEALKVESDSMRDVAVRTSKFVDAILFPANTAAVQAHPGMKLMQDTHGSAYPDIYGYLAQQNGWLVQGDSYMVILRTCVMEISLDYCQRFTTHVAEEWVANVTAASNLTATVNDDLWKLFSDQVAAEVLKKEPYCAIVEDCIVKDYATTECRPTTCPFQDPVGCRYLTTCLNDGIQNEYAEAMGVTLSSKEYSGKSKSSKEGEPVAVPDKQKSSKKWGLA